MHRSPTKLFLYSLAMVLLALLAGCSSATLSATPFTGDGTNSRVAPDVANAPSPEEIERARIREELSGDRVMLWPAYYRTRRESGLTQTIFWPLAVWHRAKDDFDAAVFPLFARRRSAERSMLLTPLGGFRDNFEKNKGWSSILWPVWFRTWDGEERSWHFLYPIFNTEKTADGGATTLFPLFHLGKKDGESRFWSLPFCREVDRKRGTSRWAAGLFLISQSTSMRESWTNILLLAGGGRENRAEDEVYKHSRLLPIYFRTTNSKRGNVLVIPPAGFFVDETWSREEAEQREREYLKERLGNGNSWPYEGPSFQRHELPPLHSRYALLGFYKAKRDLRAYVEDPRTTGTILFRERRRSWLFPLFYNRDEEIVGKLSTALLGIYRSETRLRRPDPTAVLPSNRIMNLRKTTWIVPLYYHRNEETVGKRTRLLLGLYSGDTYEKAGEPTASRARFLYKLYHRVQEGDRVRGEAFPFVGWETTEDVKRWGFLGGFIGHATDAKESRTRIFWIPIRSRKTAAP